MCTKWFVLVAIVFVTEGINSDTPGHTPNSKSDLVRLLEALKKISDHLTPLQKYNPSGYEGIATMTRSLKTLWLELNSKRNSCNVLASRLKKNLELLQELNTTLSLPPKVKALEECSYPFEETDIGCFWFHKLPQLSFANGRLRCQAFGADLPIITEDRFEPFRRLLGKKYGRGYYYVWVGGTKEGTWRWIDGSKVEFSEEQWFIPNPSLRGSCMALNGGKGYHPMPWKCKDDVGFVCEKKFDI